MAAINSGSVPEEVLIHPHGRRGGGPRLSADEWTILLDIYFRHRFDIPSERVSDIDQVSEALAKMAASRGRPREGGQLRSRGGLLRRLTVLRALDRGETDKAPREARETWLRFHNNPAACAHAAAMILHRETTSLVDPQAESESGLTPRSHGPAPTFGELRTVRDDGNNHVYLMELAASVAISAVYGKAGGSILKLGRTNDIERRRAELNQGFPPGFGLDWQLLSVKIFPTAIAAHRVEQSLLDSFEAMGVCLGREFLLIDRQKALAMLARFPTDKLVGFVGSDCGYTVDQTS